MELFSYKVRLTFHNQAYHWSWLYKTRKTTESLDYEKQHRPLTPGVGQHGGYRREYNFVKLSQISVHIYPIKWLFLLTLTWNENKAMSRAESGQRTTHVGLITQQVGVHFRTKFTSITLVFTYNIHDIMYDVRFIETMKLLLHVETY